MPSVPTVIQMRQRRRQKQQRSPSGRFSLGCSALLTLALALAGVYIALAYSRMVHDLPSIEALPGLLEPPDGQLLQPTRLVDRTGERVLLELRNPAGKGSVYLRLRGDGESDAIFSSALITATLAATDPGFWQHSGYSLAGLTADASAPPRSATLAQRLVANLLLDGEAPSLRRAVRERLLAAQVTRRYGREKILEWYLNSADYGRLAFGADAAAHVYLGKSAADLNLAEAALLAGAGLDPSQNPHDAPQAALARQKQILEAMLRYQLASPLEAAQAAQKTIDVRPIERPGQALRIEDLDFAADPLFLALALQQAQTQLPRRRLLRGGLTIQTTLDDDLQQQASCTLSDQLRRLGSDAKDALMRPAPECPAGRLLPAIEALEENSGAGLHLGAQALVLDPQSGQILALESVGTIPAQAIDINLGEVLSQTTAGGSIFPTPTGLPARPIGTLGAPWIYLTAFTRGLSPGSLVWDISPQGQPAAEDRSEGPMRLRMALANDRYRPAQQILSQVGAPNVWQTVRQFGVSAPENAQDDDAFATDALGPDTLFRPMTLLEIGQAYGVLANQGLLAGHSLIVSATDDPPPLEATALMRIADSRGQTLLDWTTWQTRPIIAAELAYLMNNVLSDEAARWPSLGRPNPLEIGRPAAAKIGQTRAGQDAWTIGYTQDRLVGIWIGFSTAPEPSTLVIAQMPLASAGLYHALTKYALRSLPVRPLPLPNGVVTVKVCDPSGMLPTANCPNVVDEVFLEANRPLQTDRLYRSAAVNRETGRLATIFTPPDLIVDQAYMQAPAEAADWARATGQQAPPEMYDSIFPDANQNSSVRISSPEMFAVVRGRVVISGTVSIENLDTYRLQVGLGMNPGAWLQIGEDISGPIKDGKLGEWDTHGLNGLYALELMAVDRDGGVQRAHVLVSVDNLPPQVKIISPLAQETISQRERPEVVLLADAEEDLGETQVEMYLDGQRLMRSATAPYAFLWASTTGEHTLRVVAIDRAGNASEVSVSFSVIP